MRKVKRSMGLCGLYCGFESYETKGDNITFQTPSIEGKASAEDGGVWKETAHMYFGKWCGLFSKFKQMHNFRMRHGLFEEPRKIVSVLDI